MGRKVSFLPIAFYSIRHCEEAKRLKQSRSESTVGLPRSLRSLAMTRSKEWSVTLITADHWPAESGS